MLALLFLLFISIIKILCIVVPLVFTVAYFSYAERKVVGFMQDRIGPHRVGFQGLLQPIADVIKLLVKEIVIPSRANKFLFVIAPILTVAPALAAWAVIPFGEGLVIADINIGVLYILTVMSFEVYGIIIAGWASNSRYAFLGALRATAQIISYKIAMGFAVIGVLMAARSINLTAIVVSQSGGFTHWYWLPLFPLFIIYWLSAIAETNRLPFDMAEGESEIVGGFHVEYSGMAFGVFFLAEYANMILVSFLAVIMFFGGWLSPFEGIPVIQQYLAWLPNIFWFFAKVIMFMFSFLWLRATFPRYRYDQIMRLGWKIFIPITLLWIMLEGIAIKLQLTPWFSEVI